MALTDPRAELVERLRDAATAPYLERPEADALKEAADYIAWRGVYPGYCINPETCRGYAHCPRRLSCVE